MLVREQPVERSAGTKDLFVFIEAGLDSPLSVFTETSPLSVLVGPKPWSFQTGLDSPLSVSGWDQRLVQPVDQSQGSLQGTAH